MGTRTEKLDFEFGPQLKMFEYIKSLECREDTVLAAQISFKKFSCAIIFNPIVYGYQG